MKMNISEKLKRLRLGKNLTQEQLAEIFNVSPQAVSRWENSTAYPDITILAGIAVFYGVTVDEILGMDEIRNTESINRLHHEVHTLMENNQADAAIGLLREGLKLYPNNSGLLLTLGETLSHSSTGTEEAISLLERVLKLDNVSVKAKTTATVNLIFLYLKSKRADRANELVNSLPHIWESREVILPEVYSGNEYTASLKEAVMNALIFFCDKINASQLHSHEVMPKYIQTGVDFTAKESIAEMLEKINAFLISD